MFLCALPHYLYEECPLFVHRYAYIVMLSDRLVLVTAHGRVTSGSPTIVVGLLNYARARGRYRSAALVRCNEDLNVSSVTSTWV